MVTIDQTQDRMHKVSAALRKWFDKIAKEHGLASLKFGRAKYDKGGNFTLKIEGLVEGGLPPQALLYNSLRSKHPELPELEKPFVYGKRTYKATGANKTGTKILATLVSSGSTYLLPVEDVLALMRTPAAAPNDA